MSLVVKACGAGDGGDSERRAAQGMTGEGYAAARDIFDDAITEMLPKPLGEINGMHADRARDVRRGQSFTKVSIKQLTRLR